MLLVLAVAALPAVAIAVGLALRAPFGALAVYAALVPFGSTIALPAPPPVDNLSSLVGLLAVGVFLVRLVVSTRAGAPVGVTTALWTLLVAVAAFTTLWSREPLVTIVGTFVLLSLVALYALVAARPTTLSDIRVFELGLVVGGALVGVYAVYLGATGKLTGAVDQRFVAALGGSENDTKSDPNITAASLLLPFFVAAMRGIRPGPAVARGGALVAAGLMFIAVFLTGSRGGLLALLVGLAVLVILSPQWKRAVAALLVPVLGVVLAVAVAPSSVTERVSQDSRSSGRSDIWRIAIVSCPRYCLQGSGWSTFPTVHEDRLLSDPAARGVQRRFEAHSVWLGTLVEGGVLALALVVAGLLVTAKQLLVVPRPLRGPPLAGLAALVVSNSFLATLSFKYFWLVLLYAVMVGNVHRSVAPTAPDPAPRKVALV